MRDGRREGREKGRERREEEGQRGKCGREEGKERGRDVGSEGGGPARKGCHGDGMLLPGWNGNIYTFYFPLFFHPGVREAEVAVGNPWHGNECGCGKFKYVYG